jgi:outer membrane protein OmpA-like peptidoglycan-associated protein
MFSRSFAIRATFLAVALSCLPQAHAQKVSYFNEGQVPRPIDVARALAGEHFQPKHKMRGLAVTPAAGGAIESEAPIAIAVASVSPAPVAGAGANAARAKSDQRTSPLGSERASGILAMAIPFEFDSAKLSERALPALDSVAEGIKLVAATTRPHIVIEGHTDSIGKAIYNRQLSKQRAHSVKRYFVAKHGFPANTLVTIGKGSREPLSGMPSHSNANRRVQFRLA